MFLIGALALDFLPAPVGAHSHSRFAGRLLPGSQSGIFSDLRGRFLRSDSRGSILRHESHRQPSLDGADLSLVVDASPDQLVVTGSNITYTITVTNEGPVASGAFTVVDELPQETTFVSCQVIGGGLCGGDGNHRTVAFNTLEADAAATIMLVATVTCTITNGVEIDNTPEIQLSAPDPEADQNESETVIITASNPPPVITPIVPSTSSLWPSNHKLVNVSLDYRVTDNCGPLSTKLSVSSNEPVNGTGDGDTSPNWEIVNEHLVRLRAERSGNGNGRVYTIGVTVTDSAGQSSSQTTTVRVPKDQKK